MTRLDTLRETVGEQLEALVEGLPRMEEDELECLLYFLGAATFRMGKWSGEDDSLIHAIAIGLGVDVGDLPTVDPGDLEGIPCLQDDGEALPYGVDPYWHSEVL